jgi:hypothetical protein
MQSVLRKAAAAAKEGLGFREGEKTTRSGWERRSTPRCSCQEHLVRW